MPGTLEFSLVSPTTGQDYLIQVSIPDSPPPETGYSVMYLLDGNARFALVQAARDTLTRQGPDGESDALMIVAVGYPDTERFNKERRVEDFTPCCLLAMWRKTTFNSVPMVALIAFLAL
ncbi:hypothetical protein HSBAA_23320 [Vreelandella sulfidaeris]|uniref:Uncharacterized protein n=1 Tax=Vreelandella sulfidaeris TaxID=115553 RepID=A0A455U4L7_9GAMM|nr:hypothetical protein HSBAA_23320 [Halomonas sulfidaeris]